MKIIRKFGKLACQVLLLAVTSQATAEAANDTRVFTFGVVPQFEARKLASIWVPMLRALEADTGYQFKMVGAPRIPEFERAFQAGDFDFAYMNPYHSLIALRDQGYQPVVRSSANLFGVLVVNKDSDIHVVEDLQGSKISFPAPNALGASLLMRADLTQIHGLNFTAVYAQTHTSSYLNVLLDETAAAGGVLGTFQQLPEDYSQELRILYETRQMPAHPVVAHPRVPQEVVARVQQAFLTLATTAEGQAMLAEVPMIAPVVTNALDYQELSSWGLDSFFIRSGE